MKPSVVVTAADLDKIGTRVPEFYTGDLFCPVGKTPLYMGQPVGAVDLRDVRRLRSGAARAARRDLRASSAKKPAQSRCRTTARIVSRAWPAQRRTRPTSIRRSWLAGSARDASRARHFRCGRRCRKGHRALLRQGRGLWRTDPRELAAKNPNLWCWIASSRPSPSIRCFSSRKPASPGTTRTAEPRTGARRAVALRGGGIDRVSARQGQRPLQAGNINAQFAYVGGGFGGTGPHAIRAVRRAGGDVLSRPSRPAGA